MTYYIRYDLWKLCWILLHDPVVQILFYLNTVEFYNLWWDQAGLRKVQDRAHIEKIFSHIQWMGCANRFSTARTRASQGAWVACWHCQTAAVWSVPLCFDCVHWANMDGEMTVNMHSVLSSWGSLGRKNKSCFWR